MRSLFVLVVVVVMYYVCIVHQALVRSMNSAAASHLMSQQSLKTSPASLIDTFCRISLPADAGTASCAVADDSHSALKLNITHSSQSALTYPVTTVSYFVHSPGYLSPTGSVETEALRDLQAFAGQGGMDHISTQSPDTTDSTSCQVYTENSSIGQCASSVATDDSSRALRDSKSSSSSSICTMCGRGCGCQKHFEDTEYQQMSQDSPSSWLSGCLKVESRSVTDDMHDCQCVAQSLSLSAGLSSPEQQQRRHSEQSDIMPSVDLFSSSFELSSTLRELSVAARKPPTGSTAELIEHTIQAVVDAHVNTCLYTSDKVAAGLREYELMLSTKPPVNCSLFVIVMCNSVMSLSPINCFSSF